MGALDFGNWLLKETIAVQTCLLHMRNSFKDWSKMNWSLNKLMFLCHEQPWTKRKALCSKINQLCFMSCRFNSNSQLLDTQDSPKPALLWANMSSFQAFFSSTQFKTEFNKEIPFWRVLKCCKVVCENTERCLLMLHTEEAMPSRSPWLLGQSRTHMEIFMIVYFYPTMEAWCCSDTQPVCVCVCKRYSVSEWMRVCECTCVSVCCSYGKMTTFILKFTHLNTTEIRNPFFPFKSHKQMCVIVFFNYLHKLTTVQVWRWSRQSKVGNLSCKSVKLVFISDICFKLFLPVNSRSLGWVKVAARLWIEKTLEIKMERGQLRGL